MRSKALSRELGDGDSIAAIQSVIPDFLAVERSQPSSLDIVSVDSLRTLGDRAKSLRSLRAARLRVEELSAVVREDAFDDWVRRCVPLESDPRRWTVARSLYESYIKSASNYGESRGGRRESRLELATETRWGKMMGSLFTKKRRGAGWFYPVRIKKERLPATAEG